MGESRQRRIRIAVIAAAIGAAAFSAEVPAEAAAPAFHSTACPEDVFDPALHVDCGYIRVPENRAMPHGRTITVAAAIVHASSPHPARDPIMFLDGGPSFGAISPFAMDAYFAGTSFPDDRDIVLVDTRGTGLSSPNLSCPELDQAEVEDFYAPPAVNAQSVTIESRALQACHDRLAGEGIDLGSYTSAESAADLDALRRALGVRRWNLFAVSADGTLGLTYMRLFPNGIRSAVIDSGMSTQMLWGLDYDRGLALELDSIFAGCAADPACNATYPGLRGLFFTMVDALQQHPVTITFPDFLPHPVSLVLDGAGLFADTLSQIFPGDEFNPSAIPDLLAGLWLVTHGHLIDVYRAEFGTGPVESSHFNDAFAEGKTMSYVCHDLVGFLTRGDLQRAARDLPAFAARYLGPNYDIGDGFTVPISPAGCRIWDVGRANPVQNQPVRSDIPTLVLAGQYDTGVPPYIVEQVTQGLSNSHYYVFPNSAHLQIAFYNNGSECARTIATEFLAQPSATPDSTCVGELPPTPYATPDVRARTRASATGWAAHRGGV